MTLIVASVLGLDMARLGESLAEVLGAGALGVHVDVMDGHYGEEVTVGLPVVESLSRSTNLEVDVRLAVDNPERYAAEFVKAGARRVAVHPDSTNQLFRTLCAIRDQGAEAGAAVGPGTTLAALDDVRNDLDFISVVCSEKNWRREKFLCASIQKIKAASNLKSGSANKLRIQAEGGIETRHVRELVSSGADIIVAGTAALRGAPLGECLRRLIQEASTL